MSGEGGHASFPPPVVWEQGCAAASPAPSGPASPGLPDSPPNLWLPPPPLGTFRGPGCSWDMCLVSGLSWTVARIRPREAAVRSWAHADPTVRHHSPGGAPALVTRGLTEGTQDVLDSLCACTDIALDFVTKIHMVLKTKSISLPPLEKIPFLETRVKTQGRVAVFSERAGAWQAPPRRPAAGRCGGALSSVLGAPEARAPASAPRPPTPDPAAATPASRLDTLPLQTRLC